MYIANVGNDLQGVNIMTRLEIAKEMLNKRVSKAEPSFENPLW